MPSNTPEFNTEEPVRVNHRARNIVIAVVVVAALAVAAFFGYRAMNKNDNAPKGSETNPVVIGVVGATDPQWVEFTKQAKAQGIYVDIKDFQDYTSENPALDAGDLDMNEFQHLLYLANYNVQNKKNLQPLGGVAIYPLGLYSAFDGDKPSTPTSPSCLQAPQWRFRTTRPTRRAPSACSRPRGSSRSRVIGRRSRSLRTWTPRIPRSRSSP